MSNIVVSNQKPDGNGITFIRVFRPDGITTFEGPNGTIVTAASLVRLERFEPRLRETTFTLSEDPQGTVELYINGLLQEPDTYTVSGRVVTWVSSDFEIAPSDNVTVRYLAVP